MQYPTQYLMITLLTLFFSSCAPAPADGAQDGTEAEVTKAEVPTGDTGMQMPSPMESNDYKIVVLNDQLPSPRKEMTGNAEGIEVVVNYGSPSVKERDIWGSLVPYNEVWRTGANEATTFTIEQDILVQGQPLPAGIYGLFTIPGEDEWTVIFNSVSDQWGAYEYDEGEDVLRVQVEPQKAAVNSETLDFIVQDDLVILFWEFLAVPFEISPTDQ